MTRVLVGGFGSQYRRDDGVGPLVAEQVVHDTSEVQIVGPFSDPLDLLGHWDRADFVVLIDATRSGACAGTLHVVELDNGVPVPGKSFEDRQLGPTSTHGIGLAGVLRLARAVDRAPRRVVVVGIEGQSFDFGEGLSPAVAQCVPEAVRRVKELIEEVLSCA
jgi:hydrogenase maturation protease